MKEELRILILEDVEFDAELIEYELRREGVRFLSKRVETEENYLMELEELKPDLILADHSLPKFDGRSALKIANEKYPFIPFLFVSGKIGEEFAVSALKEGATDYIFKNNLSKLVPAIQRALKETNEKIEREKAEKALHEAHFKLEQQVLERTEALAQANVELRLEMEERQRVENKLKQSLEEKEILLKEIHHRVKNNLTIIQSLLRLQSNYITDENVLDIFRESQNRIKSMAIIHQRLYEHDDIAKIDFSDYPRTLALDIFKSYVTDPDQIKLNVETDNVMLDIDTAIPLGLILNELISNSLKYAFPDGKKGQLTVKFKIEDNKYKLIVSDDGIGIPEDLDYKNSDSLGLRLIYSLSDQIGADIKLDTTNGTRFEITFEKKD